MNEERMTKVLPEEITVDLSKFDIGKVPIGELAEVQGRIGHESMMRLLNGTYGPQEALALVYLMLRQDYPKLRWEEVATRAADDVLSVLLSSAAPEVDKAEKPEDPNPTGASS